MHLCGFLEALTPSCRAMISHALTSGASCQRWFFMHRHPFAPRHLNSARSLPDRLCVSTSPFSDGPTQATLRRNVGFFAAPGWAIVSLLLA